MNPQPLSSFPRRSFAIFTSVDRTVDSRPEHAALAARIIGKAGAMDAYLSSMLVTLLGADAAPSFAMFDAIHQTAKNAALQAAARTALPPDERDMFAAILTFVRAVDKHRNRIAHWLWATCEEIEDGFVLIDPAENFRYLVKINKSLATTRKRFIVGSGISHDYRHVRNYTKSNLQEIVGEYNTIERWLAIFRAHIHPHIEALPHLRYDQLENEPRLQKALARIRGEDPQPDT